MNVFGFYAATTDFKQAKFHFIEGGDALPMIEKNIVGFSGLVSTGMAPTVKGAYEPSIFPNGRMFTYHPGPSKILVEENKTVEVKDLVTLNIKGIMDGLAKEEMKDWQSKLIYCWAIIGRVIRNRFVTLANFPEESLLGFKHLRYFMTEAEVAETKKNMTTAFIAGTEDGKSFARYVDSLVVAHIIVEKIHEYTAEQKPLPAKEIETIVRGGLV